VEFSPNTASTAQTDTKFTDSAQTPRSVLFVAPFGLGQKTTVWARILPLAQQLNRFGVEVSLLIPPWDTPAQAGLAWYEEGVHLANVSLRGGPPMILARLLKRIRHKQPQILHIIKPVAYSGAIHTLMWWWRKLGGMRPKIVLDIDDWEQEWATLNGRSALVRRTIWAQESWGISHADGITAASQWLLAEAQRRAPNTPSCYIPNAITRQKPDAQAIDPATTLPGETGPPATTSALHPMEHPKQANGLNVLFFSRFMEVQADWLVDFCARLFGEIPNATLSVAGSGIASHLEERFKLDFSQLAQAKGIDMNRVRWLGHIRSDQITSLYESCACAIFPAQPTRLQQAKCSVRLATTLLHGVPIVASAVGEQTTYGTTGGVELIAVDAPPTHFALRVVDVLRQPSLYRERQQANRSQLLEAYNWESLGEKLYRFYSTL